MTQRTLDEIASLLGYLIKDAERHGLQEIRITVPRARKIIHEIAACKKPRVAPRDPKFFRHLDNILDF